VTQSIIVSARSLRSGEILVALLILVVGGFSEPPFHVEDDRVILRFLQEPEASDVAPEESTQLFGTAVDGLADGNNSFQRFIVSSLGHL